MEQGRKESVHLPGLKKNRGSILLEACAAIVCLVLLLQGALQLVTQGYRGLRYLKSEWELQRVSRELRSRLETYFLYQADVVQTFDNGTLVMCYGHDRTQRRNLYVKKAKSAGCYTLYSESWSPNANQSGVNPLSSPHVDVTDFKAERLSGHLVLWRMTLTYRPTGKKKVFREVFPYGS